MSYKEIIYNIYKTFCDNGFKISTDSRSIDSGAVFFALKGENFDGNKFALQALEKGASVVVADDKTLEGKAGIVVVKDALKSLQDLSSIHRQEMSIPILALTGSNGKTTTKELISRVLSKKYNVISTQGNLNNHIGVPLTLLSIRPQHDFAVVEMGANHQGEIALLSSICKPNFGYITNFGLAHLEGFGGAEGVIKGKSELYNYLRENKRLAFVNAENQQQMRLTNNTDRYTFSSNLKTKSDVFIELKTSIPFVTGSLLYEDFKSNLSGDYNFTNIAAACAVGVYFGVIKQDIISAIESYKPENNRSEWIEKDGYKIFMDSYNANPTSMSLAIDNFAKNNFGTNKKVAVLGDMLELGKYSQAEHQKIVSNIANLDFEQIILIGENFYKTNTDNNTKIKKYKNFENLKADFKPFDIKVDFFIKGSRGLAMERFLDILS